MKRLSRRLLTCLIAVGFEVAAGCSLQIPNEDDVFVTSSVGGKGPGSTSVLPGTTVGTGGISPASTTWSAGSGGVGTSSGGKAAGSGGNAGSFSGFGGAASVAGRSSGMGGQSNGIGGQSAKGGVPGTAGYPVAGGTLATGGAISGTAGGTFSVGLTLSLQPPSPGPNDVYYFTGAANDGNNINGSGQSVADGCTNDPYTYVAADRINQGQTFTTSSSPTGYRIAAIWVKHAGYTANSAAATACSNGTWWQMAAGATYTLRITDPAKARTVGFALAVATFTLTGSEGWPAAATNGINGDGTWIRFGLPAPVAVAGCTRYGFDLTARGNTFFEWLGSRGGTFTEGSAYQGSLTASAGGPDNALNTLTGDRVFLVELTTTGGTQPGGYAGAANQGCGAGGANSAGGGTSAGSAGIGTGAAGASGSISASAGASATGGTVSSCPAAGASSTALPTLGVQLANQYRPVTHAASGSLYGLANDGVPSDALIAPTKPFMFTQMAPNGQQLGNGATVPTGDALEVASAASRAGAKVTIRMPDTYPNFSYRWVSLADWNSRVDAMVSATVNSGAANIYAYEIWNEPNWTWNNPINTGMTFNDAWKSTYQRLKAIDGATKIMGPSISIWDPNFMQDFLSYCKANNVLPDIVSWHELGDINGIARPGFIATSVAAYRAMEASLGISTRPISINEYGIPAEEGVPGSMIRYIAQFERQGVESACIAYWHQSGQLSDLLTSGHETNGGWWMYKFYGDMAGAMAMTTPSATGDYTLALDGIASVDSAASNVMVVFGGAGGDNAVVIEGFGALPFFGCTAHVKAESTPWHGVDSVVTAPTTLFETDYPINNGQIIVTIGSMLATSGYRLTITPG